MPNPTSSTRALATPGSPLSSSEVPRAPVMSPLASAERNAPRVMASIRRADAVNAPPSKTPTATQSALNVSGNAIFVLNSIGFGVLPAAT